MDCYYNVRRFKDFKFKIFPEQNGLQFFLQSLLIKWNRVSYGKRIISLKNFARATNLPNNINTMCILHIN